MTRKLFFQAIGKFAAGLLIFGALLFVPAGTLRYPAGWLLIGVLFAPMFIAGIVLRVRGVEHKTVFQSIFSPILPHLP